MDDESPWERYAARVTGLREGLDEQDRDLTEFERRLLRVLAVGEEFGRAAEAVREMVGVSSRPLRAARSWSDVRMGLSRAITTALIALDTISGDPVGLLNDHLNQRADRARPHRTPEP